jgi:methyl-accepting chemotaxis protein
VALLFVAALISEVFGASITRSITEPILSIIKLAIELVHGNSREEGLPIQSKNELGTLSHSYNELLYRLQKKSPF